MVLTGPTGTKAALCDHTLSLWKESPAQEVQRQGIELARADTTTLSEWGGRVSETRNFDCNYLNIIGKWWRRRESKPAPPPPNRFGSGHLAFRGVETARSAA